MANSKKKATLMKLDLFDARQQSRMGEFHKSLPLFLAILEDYSPMSPVDSSIVLNEILDNYYEIKDLKNTLLTYSKIIGISTRNKNIESKWNQVHLSSIYYNLGFYDEALNQQLFERKTFTASPLTLASFYNNRGLYWTKAGNLDSAHSCFEKALDLIEPIKKVNQSFYALVKGNIAQVNILEKKYAEAIPLLKNDIANSRLDNNRLNIAINYIELAICFNNIKKPATALQYIDSFTTIKSEKIDLGLKLRYLKTKADIFLNLGYKDSTLKYLNIFLEQNQAYERQKNYAELYGIKVSNDVFRLQSDIKDKKKQLEIDMRQIEAQQRLNKTYFIILILFIILSVIILYLLIKLNRRRKLVESKNAAIVEQNQTINKSLKEKEILIKEIHHRVKNNLQIISSLLKLQLNITEDNEAKISLTDAHGRILSMALLHQQLMIKDQRSVVEISEFIKTLGSHIENSILNPDRKTVLEYDLEPIFMHVDVASPVCLIINEVLVNSIKHAFGNTNQCLIKITLKNQDNKISLRIQDNGTGFYYEKEKAKNTSLGLEIIESVSEQINASFKFENSNGSVFILDILQK